MSGTKSRRIPGFLHKALKSTEFGRQMEIRLASLYGGQVKGIEARNAWLHPSALYNMGRGEMVGSKRKTKAQAIGTVIHGRIVNGPELNIVLLGIPFLISSAVGTIKCEIDEKAQARKAKAKASGRRPAPAAVDGPVKTKFKKPTTPTNLAATPLQSAPHSANFVPLRQELIDLGMRPEMATALANGEFESQSAEDVLSDSDLEALIAFMEKYSD